MFAAARFPYRDRETVFITLPAMNFAPPPSRETASMAAFTSTLEASKPIA